MKKRIIFKPIHSGRVYLLLISALLSSNVLSAQSFSPSNAIKLNLSQLMINEARLTYETGIGPLLSLEGGAGFLFSRTFLYELTGNESLLSQGFSIQLGLRKYNKNNGASIIPSKLVPYLSPEVYYWQTSYKNRWFLTESNTPSQQACNLQSSDYTQAGLRLLLGWVNRRGKVMADFYCGIGIKAIWQTRETHARNTGSDLCEVTPQTELLSIINRSVDPAVTFHAGLKIGLRKVEKQSKFQALLTK